MHTSLNWSHSLLSVHHRLPLQHMWEMPLPQLGNAIFQALLIEGSVVAQHLVEPPRAIVCLTHRIQHLLFHVIIEHHFYMVEGLGCLFQQGMHESEGLHQMRGLGCVL